MENVVKYFNTVESSFKKLKAIVWLVVGMAAVISIVSIVYSAVFVARHSDNIYILDRSSGVTLTATSSDITANDRAIEAESHVRMFHGYMFNLSPQDEVIRENIEAALNMSDGSAWDYYKDQQEKGYYSRLVTNNIVQNIFVDSVKVDMGVYPHPEHTYGRVYIMRESNLTKYWFESIGQLVDVGRSKSNPNGFMLEKFAVTRYDRIETKRR